MSKDNSNCPQCGGLLPENTTRGFCPACLMKQALSSRTFQTHDEELDRPEPPSAGEIAEKFPGYEVVECLGRGGMGVVYKARQKSLDRWVAIKVLAPERVGEGRFAEHFGREAKTLAKMSHPNIVTVFDHGERDGLYYIAMELVDGVNLRDLLREGKMNPEQALAIVPSICEALEYAHGKGIVHRDIKPENLLLDRKGRIKVADFGIASLVGSTGERSGTPPYMAPEQDGGTVDRRTDIYALGAVLYEMLTGDPVAKDAVAPSQKVQMDVRIDEMVLRALDKEPEQRYQTAGEFRTVVKTISHPAENFGSDAISCVDKARAYWVPSLIACAVTSALWLGMGIAALSGQESLADSLSYWFIMSWVVYTVLWAVLHFHCWKALPARHRATGPGRAVGFLFIPLFSFYWAFVSFPKLAHGLNAWRVERGLTSDSRLTKLGVLYAIHFLLYWTAAWYAEVGYLICILDFTIFVMFYRFVLRELASKQVVESVASAKA